VCAKADSERERERARKRKNAKEREKKQDCERMYSLSIILTISLIIASKQAVERKK